MQIQLKKNLLFSSFNFGLRAINNLIVFALLARILSVSNFGNLTFLIGLAAIVTNVTDFGYRLQVVKEVANDPSCLSMTYFLQKVKVKLIVSVIIISIMAVYLHNRSDIYSPWIFYVALTAGIGLTLSMANYVYAFFEGLNKFHLQTYCLALLTSSLLIAVYFCYRWDSVIIFLSIYLVGCVLSFGLGMFLLLKKLNKNTSDFGLSIKEEFKFITPFALIVIAEIIFAKIDVLILESIVDREQLGYYLGINRILVGMSLVTLIISTSYLPVLTSKIREKKYNRVIPIYRYVLIIGVVFALLYFFLDKYIVLILLGSKFAIIESYSFEISFLIFSKFAIIFPAIYLIASSKQIVRAKIILCIVVFVAILHLNVIPSYGIRGALYVVILANYLLAILCSIVMFVDIKRKTVVAI